MMSHEEWFSYLEKPEHLAIIETGDDTSHPIEHAGDIPLSYGNDVPLSHVGQKGRLINVLHVPRITNNLVFIKECTLS